MNYREALAWLFRTQRFGIKLGLESSRRLFYSLGVPPPDARIFHVAGTNGKGSVCAMLDSILRAAGFRSALFTSPHLITFRERIRIDGEMIPEQAVARGLTSIRSLIATWEPHPTFFEITTALALTWFRDHGAQFIVLETGMGGRLDATNATQPLVSVLTPIDYDHEKWLGFSLTSIATEKAGIIKARIPVVSAIQPEEAAAVIRQRAAECDAPLTFVKQHVARFSPALHGTHQKENAALAVAALEAANLRLPDAAIERGLAKVRWPARFEHLDDRTIIDGAHNPAGARVLARSWRETFGFERASVILSVLEDKNISAICSEIAPITARFLLPAIGSERAQSPQKLALTIKGLMPEIPVQTHDSFAKAWKEAKAGNDLILIAGSLHFAGEALAFLRGEPAAYEECLQ
ncbi:MAG TPA: folylpolyglutamate synthase/dihydrofolate synthase family protein [Chthoniobacterales bacterium]